MEKQKHAGGRPREFTQEVLDDLAENLREWVRFHAKNKKFGMLRDWCFDNDFNVKYFKRYCEQNENFKDAYEYAKSWQEHIVCRQALTGALNARFAQFFLGCCHKWRSKEVEDSRYELLGNDYGRFLDHMDKLKHKVESSEEEDDD